MPNAQNPQFKYRQFKADPAQKSTARITKAQYPAA
jgi:hypothetical protein